MHFGALQMGYEHLAPVSDDARSLLKRAAPQKKRGFVLH